jgi:HAD superfamily hydrolase (TIGR01509 family)
VPGDLASLAIFDHDGVLVDSLEYHQQAWLELGRRTRLRFTAEFIRETFGMTNPSILRRLLGDAISEDEIRRYSDMKEVCYRDVARGRIRLMDGVREVLDGLTAQGVKLAIGSSGPRANLELTVAECGLDGRFAAIASLEDITRGKPDPQIFLVAAAKAGGDPARSVVFEDAPVGIQAAKSAGMYGVGLTTTHPASALEEAGADLVIADLVAYDVAPLVKLLRARGKGCHPADGELNHGTGGPLRTN